MRRWGRALLGMVLVGAAGDGLAQAPSTGARLAAALDARLAASGLGGAAVGFVVMEAATGRVIYQHDPDVPLNPASNAKLLTAAAALALLGPARTFATGILGRVEGGVVEGALVLRGQGDPSLRTADLRALARDVAAAGVGRVGGGIVVDDSWLGAEHLPPAFEQQPGEGAAFRAPVGAVSLDENALTIRVHPGAAPGAPARVTIDPPGYVEVENALATSDGGAAAVRVVASPAPGGRERVRVSGTYPAGAPGAVYRRRLERPGLAAGWALRALLEEAGVRVEGEVRVGAVPLDGLARLASRRSAPLSSLLYEVGKESNNFYAETALLAVAAEPMAGAARAPATFARGAERVVGWARGAGVDVRGMVVRNGSGLFDANRVTARQLAQVLRAAWRDPAIASEFVAQLAVGGDDGTLRSRLRDGGTARRVRAKTGTLRDAVALSGYVLAVDPARTLVFAFVSNGVRGRGEAARQLADGVATELLAATAR